jgi:hypothetical protein
VEQLNLFNLVEENDEKKIDTKVEKVTPNNQIIEVYNEDELHLAEATALKEDKRDELLQSSQMMTQLQVTDKVKIVLISEEVDSETHNYRKYYEPHLIGKVGEITNVFVSSRGKVTYEVDVYGEKSIFEEAELLWIG